MYNEMWFRDKLAKEYPGVNLWTKTTYQDLYRLSLKSGKIHRIEDSNQFCAYMEYKPYIVKSVGRILSIEGIKAAEITSNFYMVLKFNGDLFAVSDSTSFLIDTEVIDINYNSYIKNNEWYLITDISGEFKRKSTIFDINKELIMKDVSPFISVSYLNSYICAITKYKLYCLKWNDLENRELITLNLYNNKKMVTSEYFQILHVNGNITEYNPYDKVIKAITSISEDHMEKIIDIYPMIEISNNKEVIMTKLNSRVNQNSREKFVKLNMFQDNIKDSIKIYGYLFVLVNGEIHQYNLNTGNWVDKLNYKNVKSIQ
jgi:hypothetical protein